jgi:thioredoxin-like negative regulator of GroEL
MFYKADTERERELAYVFNISSIPQVLYIPMDGRPILLKGLYPKEEIVKIIDEFLLAPRPEAQQVLIAEPQPESVVEAQPEPEKEKRKSIWEKWKERLKGKKK